MLTLLASLWIAPAQADPVNLVAFGDSLTAGLGLDQGEAYPAQLEKALKDKGYEVAIANRRRLRRYGIGGGAACRLVCYRRHRRMSSSRSAATIFCAASIPRLHARR
ncbi:MAG: hypothetical protein R3D43_06010 [Tepidamorphaceae bacterium]